MGENKSSHALAITPINAIAGDLASPGQNLKLVTPLNMEGMLSTVASENGRTNVSKPFPSKAARLPLSNVTNNEPVAIVPPKRRSNARKGLVNNKVPKPDVSILTCAPVTSSNGIEPTVQGNVNDNSPCGLKNESIPGQNKRSKRGAGRQVLSSGGNKADGEAHGRGIEIADSTRNEEDVVSKSVTPAANAGKKRGRDDRQETVKFGRRTARRREAGPLPPIAKRTDVSWIQTNQGSGNTAQSVSMSSKSKANAGVKRRRGAQEEYGKSGRQTERRRKENPSPNEAKQGDITELLITYENLKTTVNEQEDAEQLSINEEVEGKSVGKELDLSAKFDHPGTTAGTSFQTSSVGVAKMIDRPFDRQDGEGQTNLEVETRPSSPRTSVQLSNGVESHSSDEKTIQDKEPMKSPVEMVSNEKAVLSSGKVRHVVMFTNMADENQKKKLAKHVEQLEGEVTCDGCQCTHLVTGEVRRTLNFCVAISSGSWIISPEWLKTSVKQKRFVDEERFILRDRRFESKYKVSLRDVISRARQRPNRLLDGMHVLPTPHLHPSVDTICQIVRAAGGKILQNLGDIEHLEDMSCAVAVTCEEDKSEAKSAQEVGLKTFSSDWLLTCIVKQELDLTAPSSHVHNCQLSFTVGKSSQKRGSHASTCS